MLMVVDQVPGSATILNTLHDIRVDKARIADRGCCDREPST